MERRMEAEEAKRDFLDWGSGTELCGGQPFLTSTSCRSGVFKPNDIYVVAHRQPCSCQPAIGRDARLRCFADSAASRVSERAISSERLRYDSPPAADSDAGAQQGGVLLDFRCRSETLWSTRYILYSCMQC